MAFHYPLARRAGTLLLTGLLLAHAPTTASTPIVSGPDDCTADAGTLAGYKPADCLQDGGTAIGGIPLGDAVVPPGHAINWVLALQPEGVIVQVRDESIFDVYAEGHYSIHTIVHDTLALDLAAIIIGTTTLAQLEAMLVQGGGAACGALDMTGTGILVENPATGGHFPYKDQDCLEEGGTLIGAQPIGGANVPEGYTMTYLFSHGAGQVIVASAPEPYYTAPDTGLYAIHALVYHPATLNMGNVVFGTTTIADLNALLLQGGGGICAALDVDGAQTLITTCPDECLADAGGLAGYKPADCLQDGGTAIGGIPLGDAVVPPGHAINWVLALQPEGVIVQVRDESIFDVYAEGHYSIHTIVHDTLALDLAAIIIGTTTLAQLEAMLVQGGGAACGALDMTGTGILVENPATGGHFPYKDQDCLEEGGTLIGAQPIGGANVPEGYTMTYLFSHGAGQVIVASAPEPYYTAPDTGLYAIHALVYHPATLNMGNVVFGTTTIADLNALLLQGGGGICAALDVDGAQTLITPCPDEECLADAGTLDGDSGEFGCLEPGGTVTITAFPNGDAVVPPGHEVIFLLAQGPDQVVIDIHTLPEFTVSAEGTYHVHTVVYDPATFDPTTVAGTASIPMVHALMIGGGGTLCGAVDTVGAAIDVAACPDQCLAYAGTLTATATPVCMDNGVASITALPNGDAFVPPGHATVYLLTLGQSQVVLNAGVLPTFTVNAPGTYGIHAMVFQWRDYDPGSSERG
ncbi:MAG: hypothetical protein RBT71_06715, partial [Flavobacteriales bacterium]|nr:hypothetical protein [Flavobacteriales bacterium]